MLSTKAINYYEEIAAFQNELISVYGKDLKLKWVNDAYARYFAKGRDELIGSSFLELVPKVEHKKLIEIHKTLNKDNPIVTHIDQTLSPSGEITWFQWKNSAIFSDSGRFIEFRAVGIDVTELVHLRTKLKELESLPKDIQKQNDILIGTMNEKSVIVKLSDIFYIRANLKKSEARTIDGFVELNKSVGFLEKELDISCGFFRVHRSYLVALDKIERLENIAQSRFKIYMKLIPDEIETSREGAKKLREISVGGGKN